MVVLLLAVGAVAQAGDVHVTSLYDALTAVNAPECASMTPSTTVSSMKHSAKDMWQTCAEQHFSCHLNVKQRRSRFRSSVLMLVLTSATRRRAPCR